MKIAENRLLLGSVTTIGLYWVLSPFIAYPRLEQGVNLFLLVVCGLLAIRFLSETAKIVFLGKRNDEEPEGDGSHLAIYGTFLIGLGGVFAGAAGLLDPYVSGTPFAIMGRFVAGWGVLLNLISPNVTNKGFSLGRGAWSYAAIAAAIIFGYVFGHIGIVTAPPLTVPMEDISHIPSDRPVCPEDRPVWGSASGAYHERGSVYRKQVIPARCFTSVEEAEEAGFRQPQ